MLRFMSATVLILGVSASAAIAADVNLSQEGPGQWRASKLAGVTIYGPDDKSVGKISDMLVGKDGKIQYVVIGVGGFLGIGQKDVAIPFDQVVFTDEPVKAPPSTMGTSTNAAIATPNAAAPAVGGNTMAGNALGGAAGMSATPSVGLGATADPALSAAAPAPRSTAYPDHGRIDMTVDQLKSAPAFHFAS